MNNRALGKSLDPCRSQVPHRTEGKWKTSMAYLYHNFTKGQIWSGRKPAVKAPCTFLGVCEPQGGTQVDKLLSAPKRSL